MMLPLWTRVRLGSLLAIGQRARSSDKSARFWSADEMAYALQKAADEETIFADALEREAGLGWQPIETAPKDEKQVLLAVKQGIVSSGITHWWNVTVPAVWRQGAWQAYGRGWAGEIRNEVVAWQPLPEPPTPQTPPQSGSGI